MDTDTPSVLIVEDEPDLANLYTTWLEGECTVRTASNGAEALDAIDEDVDIVLLDRRMPELSGDTVLDTIRERDLECRVAMVTAVEPDFDIIEMGFDDYLVKPVSEAELRRVVDQLLLRSSYDEQLRRLFALASKKALLDAEKNEAELAASREYDNLRDRIAVARTRVDETMTAVLEQDDVHDITRNISRDALFEE